MPYISPARRKFIDPQLGYLIHQLKHIVASDGDMNYVITKLIKAWIERRGKSYTNLNAAMGILESVKQEFYRRDVAPYEDKKIAENGDI